MAFGSSLVDLASPLLGIALPGWGVNLLIVAFLFISVVMILVVLIQKPQGGGLSGAFGASADGAGQTALGVKTGDVLTTATIVIFVVFLLFAIALNFATRPESRRAAFEQGLQEEAAEQTQQQAAEEGGVADDGAAGEGEGEGEGSGDGAADGAGDGDADGDE